LSWLISIAKLVNKFSGIQVPIYWVKLWKICTELGFVMDLHLNQDSFTTHLSEITKFLKLIMKKLKNKLRNMPNKNNNMKEFC